VALDRYLIELCKGIGSASSSPDQAWPLVVDADPLIVATDVAVPLALIVNELVSNALQHSKPIGEAGGIRVLLKTHSGSFEVSVSDAGDGPAATQLNAGLGTRIVETLARQIGATVARERSASGYKVTVTVSHSEGAASPRLS
jgi:two-component sensor histidine kinase